VREALDRLDAAGVMIEIDDFGTGYASLAHLRAFPVSRLKIDRSFIDGLERDDDSDVIVQAVIDLGHNLGCEIIAEGVEKRLRRRPSGCAKWAAIRRKVIFTDVQPTRNAPCAGWPKSARHRAQGASGRAPNSG
jgi:predicted signal transduction protein with EAL and GGDEF domain